MSEMEAKSIEEYQWSMGNGQCPRCYGSAPHKHWWTDYIGHKKDCSLAQTMEKAGLQVDWEMLNPERAVGWYVPDKKRGFFVLIRANDPQKEEKLEKMTEYGYPS